MSALPDLSLILLHDQMVNKNGEFITSSLTLIDVHDLARSCRTFGLKTLFIAHPAPTLRKLASTLKTHWEEGFGSTYNPNRKEALEQLQIIESLDVAIEAIKERTNMTPKLIATSAKKGESRLTFTQLKTLMAKDSTPYLLMLGTGWGMNDALLSRADYFLEPILGPTDYNHLSVRSAGAIMLDRLLGQ